MASRPLISVMVAAHNGEGRDRMLGSCAARHRSHRLEIVVVCNGCTDATADVAAAVGPPVRVISVPKASKIAALNAGEGCTRCPARQETASPSFLTSMGDDHFVRDLVSPAQRQVVESVTNTVRVSRTYRDLLRSKARVHAGNRELDHTDAAARHRARRRRREWISVVRHDPRLLPHVPAYLGVAMLSRLVGVARKPDSTGVRWPGRLPTFDETSLQQR